MTKRKKYVNPDQLDIAKIIQSHTWKGEQPKKKAKPESKTLKNVLTEEQNQECQRLIIGATGLMTNRLNRVQEPPVSQMQYDLWLQNVKCFTRDVVTGAKTYEELYKYIEESINMPYAPDKDDLAKDKFMKLVGEQIDSL